MDYTPQILIDESVKTKKLKVRYKEFEILHGLIMVALFTAIIGSALVITLIRLPIQDNIPGNIFFAFFFALVLYFGGRAFQNNIKTKILSSVQGNNYSENRIIVKAMVKHKKWEVVENKAALLNIAAYNNAYNHIFVDRRLYVFFNEKEILLSCQTFMGRGLLSPFHLKKDKEITAEFVAHLKKEIKYFKE